MSARRSRIGDPSDQSLVDEAFWAKENEFLRHRLTLLEEYAKLNRIPRDKVWSRAEECRHFEYEVQCLNATLRMEGKLAEVREFIEGRIESDMPRKPKGFETWWFDQDDKERGSEYAGDRYAEGTLLGLYKCFDASCRHYVYGFESAEALREHMLIHLSTSAPPSLQTKVSNHMSYRTSGELKDFQRMAEDEGERSTSEDEYDQAHRSSMPYLKTTSLLNRSGIKNQASPHSNKVANIGGFLRYGTCMRCKILKKKCDCRSPCKECPLQDLSAADYWKALGCFHGSLTEFAGKCLPGQRSGYRNCYNHHRSVRIEVIQGDDRDFEIWNRELDNLMNESSSFSTLRDDCWEDPPTRERYLSLLESQNVSPLLPNQASYKRLFGTFGPALGLLKITRLDSTYLGKTAFNPFTLFRVGNSLAEQFKADWKLYALAKTLLVNVTRLYEQETTIFTTVAHRDGERTVSEIPPIRLPNIMAPLTEFLKTFDQLFANRSALSPEGWLGAFYALCVFSIVKSLLIDTLSIRDEQERPSPWKSSDAVQINSVFKVLVSVFTWSAKNSWCPKDEQKTRDPLLQDWRKGSDEAGPSLDPTIQDGLRATQALTKQWSWKSAGIKQSKDFLMNLGTGDFLSDGFNGFLKQRYDVRAVEKHQDRQPRKSLSVMDIGNAVSSSAMDVDVLVEPTAALGSSALGPLSADTPWKRPPRLRAESSSSRRATFPEVPKERGDEPPRRPLPSEPHSAYPSNPVRSPSTWQPSQKSFHRQDPPAANPSGNANAEELGYWSAPSRSNTGLEANPNPSLQAGTSENSPRFILPLAPRAGDRVVQGPYGPVWTAANSIGPIRTKDEAWRRDSISKASEREPGQRSPTRSMIDRFSNVEKVISTVDSVMSNASQSQGTQSQIQSGTSKRAPDTSATAQAAGTATAPHDPAVTDSEDFPLQHGESVMEMEIDSQRLASPMENLNKLAGGLEAGTLVFSIHDSAGRVGAERPPKKTKSKEQREHTAAIRKLKACPECRAKKTRCSPTHHRSNSVSSPKTS